MIKGKKVLRNIVILICLLVLLFNRSGLYLTPLAAHESSERSIHYGPSEVVHIADFDGGKYILSKYDKWISCNTVKRSLFFFWRFGNQATGIENDQTKGISYTWGMSNKNYKLYGIINDQRITKIQITLKSKEVFEETKFYNDMFLFTGERNEAEEFYIEEIKGYDSNNNVIFENQ